MELLLGGKDNFAADRELADRVLEVMPSMPVIARAARTLDFARPAAVLLIAVLHFIPDADDPYAIVARLMDAVPSGSHLVIAYAARDIAPDASAEMARRYNQMSPVPITPRARDQVVRFFDGLDLIPPGLVPISQVGPGRPDRCHRWSGRRPGAWITVTVGGATCTTSD